MQWLIDIVLENFKGMILLWSGAIVDIPNGWHLCDGTEGTPDLRDQFVPGAGNEYGPGDHGGTDTHAHPFTGDGHNHQIALGGIPPKIAAGANYDQFTNPKSATGNTDTVDNRPQYYSLAYIQKL